MAAWKAWAVQRETLTWHPQLSRQTLAEVTGTLHAVLHGDSPHRHEGTHVQGPQAWVLPCREDPGVPGRPHAHPTEHPSLEAPMRRCSRWLTVVARPLVRILALTGALVYTLPCPGRASTRPTPSLAPKPGLPSCHTPCCPSLDLLSLP